MSNNEVRYSLIPARLGVCAGGYCPNREALRVRRDLWVLDPYADGKITKAEVQKYYPCVNWNNFYRAFQTFYHAWSNRRLNYECWNRNNTWARARRLLSISFSCVKKPIKVNHPTRQRRKPRRRWRPRRKKKPPMKPVPIKLATKDPIKKLEDLRRKMRTHPLATTPPRMSSGGSVNGSGKKGGCDCNDGWLALLVALALLIGLRLLLGRKKKDDNGNNDSNQKVPQPDWNAIASGMMVHAASKEVDPQVPIDWNAMIAMKAPPGSVPQWDLRGIAAQLRIDAQHRDASSQLVLEAQAAGIRLHLFRHGDVDGLQVSGMHGQEDAVPLLYYWIQHTISDAVDDPSRLSRFFIDVARTYHGRGLPSKYGDERLGLQGEALQLDHLVGRVSHQLEQGHPLFNVEASMAHIADHLRKSVAASASEEERDAHLVFDHIMCQAMREVAAGDMDSVISRMETGVRVSGVRNRAVLGALFSLNAAELYYRKAACEFSAARARSLFNGSKEFASKARNGAMMTLSAQVVTHAMVIESMATASLNDLQGVELCNPLSRQVPGYGPTSAVVVRNGTSWGITPLARIKVMRR